MVLGRACSEQEGGLAVLYPLTYIATTSSLTLLLICVGLLGDAPLAADLAIAQGSVLATFYAFSANARNLILQRSGATEVNDLLLTRLAFIPPLFALSYFLSVEVAGVTPALASAIIVRRACEWLGEVHLSAIERDADRRGVMSYFLTQTAALAALVAVLVAAPAAFSFMLWVWALVPLLGVARRILPRLPTSSLPRLVRTLRLLVPHAGSTLIVGISIYLLRVIIVLVTDREFAGLLFTAIAIGSFAGSLFANVLGPSLALRLPGDSRPRLLVAILCGFVVSGAALVLVAPWLAGALFGKPELFWQTVGLSLVGSAVMIEAQRIRLVLFDASHGDLLFGPDVLRTLTLMIIAPAVAILFTPKLLALVYLLDALLTWIFYASARTQELAGGWLPKHAETGLRIVIGVLLVFPFFVQLSGHVYHSPELPMLDSGGMILNLPLPISIPACFVGTLLLARFRRATLSMAVIFFLFVGTVLTSVAATGGEIEYGSRKLLLLLQFLLPAFALILGQMFESSAQDSHLLSNAFVFTLACFVPAQLFLSWQQGHHVLTHNMEWFSIYQHRQYVPVVFVGAYLFSLFSLWESANQRPVLVALGLLMAVYTVMSYSTLALALLLLGVAVVAVARIRPVASAAIVAAVVLAVGATLWQLRHTEEFRQKYVPPEGGQAAPLPENVTTRIHDWSVYARGVTESGKSLLFGHAEAFERSVSTSAHNYYLDLMYNFGLIAFLPLLGLIAYTCLLVIREPQRLTRDLGTFGLCFIVLFIILVDNNFKVNLRQPYPGIFSFFLWGMLLGRLGGARTAPRTRAKT